jgi:hypothetical protein
VAPVVPARARYPSEQKTRQKRQRLSRRRPGNDTLIGRPGNDRVGVIGQDHLEGNEGDDTIVANGDPPRPQKSDTVECGPGNDVAYITTSSDRFVGGSAAAAGCETLI